MVIHPEVPFFHLHNQSNMNRRITSFFLLITLSLVGHACSSNTPTQQLNVTILPSDITPNSSLTPDPTSISQTDNSSTNEPQGLLTPSPTLVPHYFTEEWNDDPIQWFLFSTKGNDNLWDVYNEAGVLEMSLTGKEISVYFIYRPWEYEHVKVTTKIENRAFATSSIVIVCNYSEELGWYEFNIGTDGLWQIRAHDTKGHTGYLTLMDGGSKSIHTREAFNEISATCNGNELSLTINGTKVVDYKDNLLIYSKGKIGLGAISNSQIPVLLESSWIRVSKP